VFKQTCIENEAKEGRLRMVMSYALEEPTTRAGKRKLDDEVASIVDRISRSKK
jgi:hypothetical protein